VESCRACAAIVDTLSPGEAPRPPAELAPGTRAGRFIIEGRLGEGGMGVVYAARDPHLGRKVAVKVLRGADRAGNARLLREAQAMARLAHPNVVVVFDSGVLDDRLFVAMELVDGERLDRWLTAHRPGWRAAIDLFIQAGRGLAAAHAAGIVHRDFKPANVLVGGDGRARVLDFGLARDESAPAEPPPAGEPPAEAPGVTATGAVLGTPAYMAPEQRRGERASARADQYSFCVGLYESLYGVHPSSNIIPVKTPVPSAVAPRPAPRPRARSRRSLAHHGRPPRRAHRGLAAADGLAPPGRRGGPGRRRRGQLPAAQPDGPLRRHRHAPRRRLGRAAQGDDRSRVSWRPGCRRPRAAGAPPRRCSTATRRATCRRARRSCAASGEQPAADVARRQSCLDQRLEGLRAWATVFTTVDAKRLRTATSSAAALDDLAGCDGNDPDVRPTPADRDLATEVGRLRAELARLNVRASLGELEAGDRGVRPPARRGAPPRLPTARGRDPLQHRHPADQLGQPRRRPGDPRRPRRRRRGDARRSAARRRLVTRVYVEAQADKLTDAHRSARYAEAVLRPMGGARSDWQRLMLANNEAHAYWSEHRTGEALMLSTAAVDARRDPRRPGGTSASPPCS
jgi:serine/threonine protein kinase